jgi:hypothetical protein
MLGGCSVYRISSGCRSGAEHRRAERHHPEFAWSHDTDARSYDADAGSDDSDSWDDPDSWNDHEHAGRDQHHAEHLSGPAWVKHGDTKLAIEHAQHYYNPRRVTERTKHVAQFAEHAS